MHRPLALIATSTIAGAALLAAPQVASADEPYADGSAVTSNGTGSASAHTDADSAGNLEVSASATGGTAFLVPVLNLLPYSTLTSGQANAYVSEGIDGVAVEAGHRYEISVTFSGLDVETSEEGSGHAVAQVFGQAANGVDGAGHTQVAGTGVEDVAADGTAVLEFEAHPTQHGPIGVLAQVQVFTNAKGDGNAASAELSGTVTDVDIVEIG